MANLAEYNQQNIIDTVADKTIFCTKEVLTLDEVARYTGISRSYLYKLTMNRVIPHYKPTGKLLFFNRKEVEEWLQSNRVATSSEITSRAMAYCQKGGVL